MAIDMALNRAGTIEGNYIIPVRLDQATVPGQIGMYHDIDYFLPDGSERLISALRIMEQKRRVGAEQAAAQDSGRMARMGSGQANLLEFNEM
jgi:hypothetical protein